MKSRRLRELAVCGLFCALLCVLSPITIPMSPISFTFSAFAVMLTGAVLPVRLSVSAVVCYILLGVAGLPVFSGFLGGAGVLLGVTGGFIMAYPLMALAMGLLRRVKLLGAGFWGYCVCGLAAMVICYAFGTAWYCFYAGVSVRAALAVCVLPFIPFDAVKAALAAFLAVRLKKSGVEI